MNKANFPMFDDDESAVNEIYRVKAQIENVIEKIKSCEIVYGDKNYETFYDNVCQVLRYWVGHTYVGVRKNKKIKKAFQAFYESLYVFLTFCLNEDRSLGQFYNEFSKNILYRGRVYRYLGHGSDEDVDTSRIEPEYDGVFVSWSKKNDVSYIKTKLNGTKTLITCDITEPYYGIDLTGFGEGRENEKEVVFPMKKELIKEIIYLE